MPEDCVEVVIASALEEDASNHETGRYDTIASRYDEIYGELLPLGKDQEPTVALAMLFWDSWCDSSQHDWKYYEGIGREDWPRLARQVVGSLRTGDLITDPVLLQHFGPQRPGFLRRLASRIARRR